MIGRAVATAFLAAGLVFSGCALDVGSSGSSGSEGPGESVGQNQAALGRSPMTRDQILDISKSVVGYSYFWGGDRWDPDSKKYPGKCSGSCPNCTHWAYPSGGPEWGADCSGFVGQAWQVPYDRSIKTQMHPFTTYNFRFEKEHWYPVSRSKLKPGDAIVHHSGSSGHVAIFDRYASGGQYTVYECAGCMIGCKHDTRYFDSAYIGIRRRDVSDEPANKPPKGRVTSGSCGTIRGWAQDPDAKKEALDVVLTFVGPIGGNPSKKITVKADIYGKKLCDKLGSCKHGFEADFPEVLIDGKKHSVYAYAIDSTGKGHKLLAGSPRSVKCGSLKGTLTKKYSSLRRFRGKGADFVACSGQEFDLGLAFKNKGTAVWRDVSGRGKTVGSDVFLVTANGKADKLTGKKRFSLGMNDNDYVRGDHSAPNCVHKRGCRKTLFVDGGMHAKAPSAAGVYLSRWRLRDYSEVWSHSKGFGPKVDVRVKVMKCDQPPNECGCHIWCSDGKNQKLYGYDIGTADFCKTVGEAKCSPAKLVSSTFEACPEGTGGASGVGGGVGTGSGGTPAGGGTSGWPTGGGGGGSGGTSGAAGASGDGGAAGSGTAGPDDPVEDPAQEESGWTGWEEEEGSSISPDDEPDDADFEDDGFTGDADHETTGGTTPAEDSGCSLATPRTDESGLGLLGVVSIGALFMRRRRRQGPRPS